MPQTSNPSTEKPEAAPADAAPAEAAQAEDRRSPAFERLMEQETATNLTAAMRHLNNKSKTPLQANNAFAEQQPPHSPLADQAEVDGAEAETKVTP